MSFIRELPSQFIENIKSIYPSSISQKILNSLSHDESKTGIRLSQDLDSAQKELLKNNITPLCFSNRGYITNDITPQEIAGILPTSIKAYSQDPSCMIIEWLCNNIKGRALTSIDLVVDLCAAPGGKTLILSDVFTDSLILANEIDPKRQQSLNENVKFWDCKNVMCVRNQGSVFKRLENKIDVMLVDAPCSGEGMFRKVKTQSIIEWSPKNIEICVRRQKDILYNTLPALAIGGHLIYSTCTYNTQENEEIVQWMCDELNMEVVKFDPNQLPKDSNCEILSIVDGCYRLVPPYAPGEGLFWSLLVKKAEFTPKDYTEEEIAAYTMRGRMREIKSYRRSIPNLHNENKAEVIKAWDNATKDYNIDFKNQLLYCTENTNYFLVQSRFDALFQDAFTTLTVSRQLQPLGRMFRKDLKTLKVEI
jgi:16S rRNA (cytosine1407-C5)-methyltransferase